MRRARHPEDIRPRELLVSRVETFFNSYQTQGQSGIAGARQTQWRFVADGLGAAQALAAATELIDPDDQKLRKLVAEKQLEIADFCVQALAIVPANWGSGRSRKLFCHAGTVQLQSYWKLICRTLGLEEPFPSEVIASRNPSNSDYSLIRIRYIEPLFYPIPSDNDHLGVPKGFIKLASSQIIAPSAIFFASAIARLRSLTVELKSLEEYYLDATGRRHAKEPTREGRRIRNNIYISLVAASLYMAVTTRTEESRQELGFTPDEWLTAYESGHDHGSRIFGLVGATANLKFLQTEVRMLEEWSKGAVEWWIGRERAEVEGDGEVLSLALEVLHSELQNIFRAMFTLWKSKQLPANAHVPVNRNSIPSS